MNPKTMVDIRKISVGADYKNNAMHYLIGQPVLDKTYEICHIRREDDDSISIYIEKNKEQYLWKSFNSNMPMSIEYNINFE